MLDKTYEYMNWPRIEAVIYGEENFPREILGPHLVKKGILFQCYFPGAKSVKVHLKEKNRSHRMIKQDEAGYFAVLISGREVPEYEYLVQYEQSEERVEDPYRFGSMLSEKEERAFCEGVSYEIYKKMGAHPMRRGGVRGVYFAIWAPNALCVNVVGDFNHWDGRENPMHKSAGSGIYELFLPSAKPGDLYKFELTLHGGVKVLRTDPYAMEKEPGSGRACVVPDARPYTWEDGIWMKERKEWTGTDRPLSICEISLMEWGRKEDGTYENYRDLAGKVGEYVSQMGYTHIELNPIMEFEGDKSNGFGTSAYFAPARRFGTPVDFKYFVNDLHKRNIGVILDWTAAHFPVIPEGMHNLDGTCLYENADPKKKMHPFWNTMLFNYGSPMVREFLISNAFYWIECFHLDGLRLDDVAAMLYLDYGRNDGEWTPNLYGSNENLEAIGFLKHLNSVVKREYPEVLLIAQEDALWPSLTGPVDETHMGFDYKWNNGWTGNFLDYLRHKGEYRREHHDELTSSMLYAYCENYILTFNKRDVGSSTDFLESLPGKAKEKTALLKAAYGYLMTHPGKKMVVSESQMDEDAKACLAELLHIYRQYPAFYELDCDPEGFEWIQLMEAQKKCLAFCRKTKKKEDTLLVVCNFSRKEYSKYQVGVPFAGKYKEIFNSDSKLLGGEGFVNPRVKTSKPEECNEREQSIVIKLAPLSMAVFSAKERLEKERMHGSFDREIN